jgi:hypothetical protein
MSQRQLKLKNNYRLQIFSSSTFLDSRSISWQRLTSVGAENTTPRLETERREWAALLVLINKALASFFSTRVSRTVTKWM